MAHNRFYQNFDFVWVFSKGSPRTFNPLIARKGKPHERTYYHGGTKNAKGEFPQARGKRVTFGNGVKRDAVWGNAGRIAQYRVFVRPDYHPAPMPMRLAVDLITAYSNVGDLVLDPFSGSGTTAYAAQLLGRRAIGVEIHAPYIDEAISKRFIQHPLVVIE